MREKSSSSRVHDLLGSALGVFALVMLLLSPWQVDRSGPDPFYKGPLLFPLITLCLMLAGSVPSIIRMVRPGKTQWYLDGHGKPFRAARVLGCLILYLGGLIFAGLEIATFVFLLAALKLVGQDTLVKLSVIPLLVTVILVVIFKYFLAIWFPEPLVMQFFME